MVVEDLFCRFVFYENTNNSRSQSIEVEKYKKEVTNSRLESLPLGMYTITWFTFFYASSTGNGVEVRHISMTLANKEVGGVQKICAVFGYRALEKINKDKSPDVKYHYFRIVIEIFYGIANLCQSIKRIFFSEIVVLNNRETRQLG